MVADLRSETGLSLELFPLSLASLPSESCFSARRNPVCPCFVPLAMLKSGGLAAQCRQDVKRPEGDEGEQEKLSHGGEQKDKETRGERQTWGVCAWCVRGSPLTATGTRTSRNGEWKRSGEGLNGERGRRGRKGNALQGLRTLMETPRPLVQFFFFFARFYLFI